MRIQPVSRHINDDSIDHHALRDGMILRTNNNFNDSLEAMIATNSSL
ncbi:hypothetical protein [Bradyrhizobium sp. SRS-191]|nr:hypothetical protein [Bradyrhizobium sp. SRS-191]